MQEKTAGKFMYALKSNREKLKHVIKNSCKVWLLYSLQILCIKLETSLSMCHFFPHNYTFSVNFTQQHFTGQLPL